MLKNRTIFQSFKYSFEGLFHAIAKNKNMKIHIAIGIIVMWLGLVFRVKASQMGILGVMVLLVIMAEMINTSIEEMVNLITQEHRKEAKVAKDVASGMVLVAVTGSVIAGVLIFAPYILKLLH